MKKIFIPIFLLVALTAKAQSDEKAAIQQTAMDYIESFYEGDTLKLKRSVSESLYKYGYWKDKTGNYYGQQVTFKQALKLAKNPAARKQFETGRAPKEATILDVQGYVACVKVTAWWGVDYLLLSKKEGTWKIEQALFEGPLSMMEAKK